MKFKRPNIHLNKILINFRKRDPQMLINLMILHQLHRQYFIFNRIPNLIFPKFANSQSPRQFQQLLYRPEIINKSNQTHFYYFLLNMFRDGPSLVNFKNINNKQILITYRNTLQIFIMYDNIMHQMMTMLPKID